MIKKLKPLTLEQIQEIVKNEQFDKFFRSLEIEQRYKAEKNQAIEKLKTKITNYRKQNMWYRWLICRNDYPYHLAEGLEHGLIGDVKQKNGEKSGKNFRQQLNTWRANKDSDLTSPLKMLLEKESLIGGVNPPKYRSVDIPHIHLVKKAK